MSAEIEVVAVAARTPVGLTAESSSAAVRAAISRCRQFPFVDVRGAPLVVAADTQIDDAVEGAARLAVLVKSVLDEAADKLAAVEPHAGDWQLLLALPESRPGFSEADAAAIAEVTRAFCVRRGLGGEGASIEIAGRGHAGAIRAVELAVQRCGPSDRTVTLVVGADSYVHPDAFTWLERERRFARAGARSGLTPGEGAGCLVLVPPRLRARLRLPRLARVRGAHTAVEPQGRTSEQGSSGVGMSRAVAGALDGLSLPREGADLVYVDINGERYRSEEWGMVTLRLPEARKTLDYEVPSACWGDVGAAFGALGGVLAVHAFARGYAAGPRALVVAGSDSGLRGALLMQDPRAP
jgi:3-oxoacyl-[acyl-carrier-protein] synthase-1